MAAGRVIEKGLRPAAASDDGDTAPSAEVKAFLAKAIAEAKTYGWSGYETRPVKKNSDTFFMEVTQVHSEGPAAQAGFQTGDVIVAINGLKLTRENLPALKAQWKGMTVGGQFTYLVTRQEDGKWDKQELSLTLAEAPHDVLAKRVGQRMLREAGMGKKW
ncbi:MAG: PDZ domain-containing protein [Acidobacteriota bacterium]